MEQEDFFVREEKPEYLQYKDRFRLCCVYNLVAYGGGAFAGLLSLLTSVLSLMDVPLLNIAQSASGAVKIAIYLALGVAVVLTVGFSIAAIVGFSKALLKERKNLLDLESYALKEYNGIKARREKTKTRVWRSFGYLLIGMLFVNKSFMLVPIIICTAAMPVCSFLSKKTYDRMKKTIIAKEYER